LRSEFPNPQKLLLPGSFIRVQLDQAHDANGITVPQRAVQRDAAGKAIVLLVDAQGQVEERQVEVDGVRGNRWIVQRGLSAGERVIIEGLQHVQPGMAVTAQESGNVADSGANR